MNNNLNFIKNIDNLGRIVIPMDIRRKLNINSGDLLSISFNDNNISLYKYSSLRNNKKIYEIINYFIEFFNLKVILVDKESVVLTNVINSITSLDGNMKVKVSSGNIMKYVKDSIILGNKKIDGVFNMIPIITNDGIVGSLIVLGDELSRSYDLCSIIVKIITLELNIS